MMKNYELHEFDPTKVFTKEINIFEVNSFKYESYDLNTLGQLIIDKNNNLEGKRKFISLATKKISQAKFNQVIDIDFAEFTAKNTIAATLEALQAKINSLEADKEILSSGRDTDKQKINSLNNQINALQAQILAITPINDSTKNSVDVKANTNTLSNNAINNINTMSTNVIAPSLTM
jgi:hypothetical protein